jgi:hypothetical protein
VNLNGAGLIRQFGPIKQTRAVEDRDDDMQNVDDKTLEEREELIDAIKGNVLFADCSQCAFSRPFPS